MTEQEIEKHFCETGILDEKIQLKRPKKAGKTSEEKQPRRPKKSEHS